LVVLASKPLKDVLLVCASKPDMDGLVVWASKPSATGLTGLGLKIGEWQIGEHVVASQTLRRGKAMSRRRRVRWIDEENLGRIYP
jgi:hypothetical protein